MGLVVWAVLVPLWQNCMGGFQAIEEMGADQSSLGAEAGDCEAQLMNLYRGTYYGLLSRQCALCHTNGPGIGKFGSSDFDTSYAAFRSMGRTRIENNAVNPSHNPPYTGPVNQSFVDQYKPRWDQAESSYQACLASNGEGGQGASGNEVRTSDKSDARILRNADVPTTWTRLEWDLSTETASTGLQSRRPPVIVGIDVRVATLNGERKGYEFRNPTARLKPGVGDSLLIRGLHLGFNGEKQTRVTTYEFLNVTVPSATDLNLSPGTAYALLVEPELEASDRFALIFDSVAVASGGAEGSGEPMPTPTPAAGTAVTFQVLISNDPSRGVFKRSCLGCHSGAAPSAGLDLSNYAEANANAIRIVSRMGSAGAPMPPSGVLPQADRNLVQQWINDGKPQQ